MTDTINPLRLVGSSVETWKIVMGFLQDEAGHACQLCGGAKKRLLVHHINGCGLDNRRENLIVLCDACHNFAKKKVNQEYGSPWNRKIQRLFRKAYGWE